jgi:hypothetical protein
MCLWNARAAREPHLHWNHLESAKLLEVAWAQLPRRALATVWRFEDEEFGLSRKQCNDQLAADPLYLEDWDWEEQESPVDDPADGTEDYMRDKPHASDGDESEPGWTDTWNGRYRRQDRARTRATARQNVDIQVRPVDINFHSLPTFPQGWTGKSAPTKEKKDQRKARVQLRSYKASFSSGPFGRRYDRPDGPPNTKGFVIAQSIYHRRGEGDC